MTTCSCHSATMDMSLLLHPKESRIPINKWIESLKVNDDYDDDTDKYESIVYKFVVISLAFFACIEDFMNSVSCSRTFSLATANSWYGKSQKKERVAIKMFYNLDQCFADAGQAVTNGLTIVNHFHELLRIFQEHDNDQSKYPISKLLPQLDKLVKSITSLILSWEIMFNMGLSLSTANIAVDFKLQQILEKKPTLTLWDNKVINEIQDGRDVTNKDKVANEYWARVSSAFPRCNGCFDNLRGIACNILFEFILGNPVIIVYPPPYFDTPELDSIFEP